MRSTFAALFLLASTLACAGADPIDDDGVLIPDAGVTEPDAGTAAPDGGEPMIDAGTPDAGQPPIGFAETEGIFRVRCAPCHEVGNMRNRIVVTDYDRIVNRPSPATQMPYITPGDPDASWIYRKITGTQVAVCADRGVRTRDCGGIMPTRDGTALTPQEVDVVRAWITAGAER